MPSKCRSSILTTNLRKHRSDRLRMNRWSRHLVLGQLRFCGLGSLKGCKKVAGGRSVSVDHRYQTDNRQHPGKGASLSAENVCSRSIPSRTLPGCCHIFNVIRWSALMLRPPATILQPSRLPRITRKGARRSHENFLRHYSYLLRQ
jgi:hypothetical protein